MLTDDVMNWIAHFTSYSTSPIAELFGKNHEVLQVCVQMNRECVAITENPDDECIQRLISNDIPEHYTPPLLEPSQPPTPEKAIGKKSKKCNTKKGRPSDFHIDTQELLQKLSQLEKTDGKKNPLKKKGELSSRIITRSTAK